MRVNLFDGNDCRAALLIQATEYHSPIKEKTRHPRVFSDSSYIVQTQPPSPKPWSVHFPPYCSDHSSLAVGWQFPLALQPHWPSPSIAQLFQIVQIITVTSFLKRRPFAGIAGQSRGWRSIFIEHGPGRTPGCRPDYIFPDRTSLIDCHVPQFKIHSLMLQKRWSGPSLAPGKIVCLPGCESKLRTHREDARSC